VKILVYAVYAIRLLLLTGCAALSPNLKPILHELLQRRCILLQIMISPKSRGVGLKSS
jgi:hypothetical protein